MGEIRIVGSVIHADILIQCVRNCISAISNFSCSELNRCLNIQDILVGFKDGQKLLHKIRRTVLSFWGELFKASLA